jgi:hypothetical protein
VQGAERYVRAHGHIAEPHGLVERARTWEKQVLSARGFKRAGRKAIRIRYINGMEVRKKRPRGFRKRPRGLK